MWLRSILGGAVSLLGEGFAAGEGGGASSSLPWVDSGAGEGAASLVEGLAAEAAGGFADSSEAPASGCWGSPKESGGFHACEVGHMGNCLASASASSFCRKAAARWEFRVVCAMYVRMPALR
jgi:hypothetical protein